MFSYGFYNSLNGDRKYNAEQMSAIFDGVIVDGVFENVGEIFATVPGAGLEVIVKTGRAWFKHTWSLNDSWMPLSLPEADTYRSRIDAVVLEVNHDIDVRKNEIKIISGEPSLVAVKPALVHDENIDQYALAYVTVPALATSILEDNIEIMVGRGDTPFVTCPLETIPIDDLFNQWDGEFTTWFNNLKAQLTDNVVTNLQSQITANKEGLETLQTQVSESLPLITDGMGAGSLFSVSKYYKEPITDAVLCNGGFISGDVYPELANVLGVNYGGTIASDLLNSLYGVNTTYGYPQVYNRDHDFFVSVSIADTRIVIYRKNQVPQVISIPQNAMNAGSGNLQTNNTNSYVVTIWNFIMFSYARWDGYSSWVKYWGVYDIGTGAFRTTYDGNITRICDDTLSTYGGLIDYGDFALCISTSNFLIRKSDFKSFGVSLICDGVKANSSNLHPILYDDPDYVYFAHLGGTGSLTVRRVAKSDFIAMANTESTANIYCSDPLGVSVSGSNLANIQGSGFVVNDYAYFSMGSSMYAIPFDNGFSGSIQTIWTASGGVAGHYPANGPIQLTDDTVLVVANTVNQRATDSANTTYKVGWLFTGGSCVQISLDFYATRSVQYSTYDIIPTSQGIRSNFRLGTIKLPTITQSESLVYMRTKTPPKGA